MAIVRKEKYLKDIASLVKKGALYFEGDDRPVVSMGGRQVFVSSVAYDMESGEMTYRVSDEAGREYASGHGVRPLSNLDIKTLVNVAESARKYAALHRERERNIVNIEARVRNAGKRSGMSL